MPDTLTITRPDDWHLHLRDGEMLAGTVPPTAEVFARAIIMPNLTPPVTTVDEAAAYRDRILAAVPEGVSFQPLMTLYLTDSMEPEEIARAAAGDLVFGCKLYPAGATTNSASGVKDPAAIDHLYAALEEHDLPLLVHGEVTQDHVDIFDREKAFIDLHLNRIREKFPKLRIVFEHVTTADAVQFVRDAGERTAATVTPQHLLMNRNHLLVGGIRPHNYCLPVLKRRSHQEAIQQAVLEGHPRFFLGTDSAPHARDRKETACGCAGCYSAPAALPLYAGFFDSHGALEKLEGFASHHGADFYRLPRNSEEVVLEKADWRIPSEVNAGAETLVPWMGGESCAWRLA